MFWESVGQTLISLLIILVGIPFAICLFIEFGVSFLNIPGPIARSLTVIYEWLFGQNQ